MSQLLDLPASLEIFDWGCLPYAECEERQLALVEDIHQKNSFGCLVFCSHPAVVTLGRSTKPEDIIGWRGPTFEVRRGGRATYHGPDQLVVYFLLNLRIPNEHRKEKDVVGLLRGIEQSTVDLLRLYGLEARGKTDRGSDLNDTGVWVGDRKIASVGIAVRNWISYHGIALNLDHQPMAFQGIQPCGFSTNAMTSLERETGKPVDHHEVKTRWLPQILLHI